MGIHGKGRAAVDDKVAGVFLPVKSVGQWDRLICSWFRS